MTNPASISTSQLDQILVCFQQLSGEEFQDFIFEYLTARSTEFRDVQSGPRRGSDGGIDIEATTLSATGVAERLAFSVKRWNRGIGRHEVADLFAVAHQKQMQQAIIVSPTTLTHDARNEINRIQACSSLLFPTNWTGRPLADMVARTTPQLLLTRFPSLSGILTPTTASPLGPSFDLLDLTEVEPAIAADAFYDGFPPQWQHLKSNFDLPRTIYTALKSQISQATTRVAVSVCSIIGTTGCGKTSLLRRAALDAHEAGWCVLRLRDDWSESGVPIYEQLKLIIEKHAVPMLVMVDDAIDLLAEFPLTSANAVALTAAARAPVLFVLAEELHHWNRIIHQNLISPTIQARVHRLLSLTDDECSQLVDKVIELEAAGHLTRRAGARLSRNERLQTCITRADRQLLVAVMKMRHGRGIRELLRREFSRLGRNPRVQEIYSLLCFCNAHGIRVPSSLLWRLTNFNSPFEQLAFHREVSGLLTEIDNHWTAAHITVARVISSFAYPTPETRATALRSILKWIDLAEQSERNLFIGCMVGTWQRRLILNVCGREKSIINSFCRTVLADHPEIPLYVAKFVHAARGAALRLIGETSQAEDAFRSALACDACYGYALRQLAWIRHSAGELSDAASLAIKAAAADERNFQTQLQCGQILQLNTLEFFKRAGQYFDRAVALAPWNTKAVDVRETHFAIVSNVLPALSRVGTDLLPYHVIKDLRPSLSALRGMFGPGHPSLRKKAWGELFYMQEQISDNGEVAEVLQELDGKYDKKIAALVASNVARLKYLNWYRYGAEQDSREIETLFSESMSLDPSNPFSFCWHGTFLKEMRGDLGDAEKYYKLALKKADQHQNAKLKRHPLILNNLALLIMDQVLVGKSASSGLLQARKLAKEAAERVQALGSDFYWPEHTLAECELLIAQKK